MSCLLMQGLAAAAATREAAKRKGHSAEDKAQPKKARRVPIISHEVAIPKGYVAKDLSEELHGEFCACQIQGGVCAMWIGNLYRLRVVRGQMSGLDRKLREGMLLCAQCFRCPQTDMLYRVCIPDHPEGASTSITRAVSPLLHLHM